MHKIKLPHEALAPVRPMRALVSLYMPAAFLKSSGVLAVQAGAFEL